jgi:hypothetical protein
MGSLAWQWVKRSCFVENLSLFGAVCEVCEADGIVREKLALANRSRFGFGFGVPGKIESAPALSPACLNLTTTSISKVQMVHTADLPRHMAYSVFPASFSMPESTVTVSGISRVIGYLHSTR